MPTATRFISRIQDADDFADALTWAGAHVWNNAEADVDYRFAAVGQTNALFIQGSDGNVGIGVEDPDEKFEVNGNIHLSADGDFISFGAAGSTDYSIQWDGSDAVHTITAGDFAFMGGKFGIGTATPAQLLDVHTAGDTRMQIKSDTSNAIINLDAGGATADPALKMLINGSQKAQIRIDNNDGDKFQITVPTAVRLTIVPSSGNIGIGTTSPQGNMQWSDENTHGGLILKTYAASSGTLTANHTITIQVNVPVGAKILGAQLHVKTALAGGETWNAQYVTGATQSIGTNQTVAQNTNLSTIFDVNGATDIASGEVDITLQRNSNPGVDAFTAQGEIEAVVYVLLFDTWDNE